MSKPGAIHWNSRASAAANARRALPPLLTDYFAGVRQVLAQDPPPAELHAIRLASKRVRYTVELFRPCYGPGLEVRLAALRRLQQVLGEVNDCAAAERLMQRVMPPSSSRRRVERFLRGRAAAKAAELRREWREVFDAPGREQWWVQYLARRAKAKQ
jgi:CHAD domain-containing protein